MQKEQGIKVDNPFEPVSVVARLALREEMATQHKLHQNTKTPTLVKALNMCNSAGNERPVRLHRARSRQTVRTAREHAFGCTVGDFRNANFRTFEF